MKKANKHGEEDRVLRFSVIAVLVLFIIGVIIVGVRALNLRVDSSAGKKKLEELSKADVNEIDAKIQELEKAEQAADKEWKNRSNNEKFAGCLVLGDSITQGLYGYEVLDQSLVIAERGVETRRPDKTGLTEILDKAVQAAPKKVFLAFGMNDVEADDGSAEEFVADYKVMLDRLKEEIPDVEIYVNSILPVTEAKKSEEPAYENIPEFNEALKKLCEEEGMTFIDNTDLVKEEMHEQDGVHMKAEYYPLWAERMAEEAEL